MKFKDFCSSLELKIQAAYQEGVTLEQAEQLAGEFLYAQMIVSTELKKADLDSRMRKAGLKAVKAASYVDACSKSDKKPTEAMLEHTLNSDKIVQQEQEGLDAAEVECADLTRYYNIFRESHIFFRGISKGKFE